MLILLAGFGKETRPRASGERKKGSDDLSVALLRFRAEARIGPSAFRLLSRERVRVVGRLLVRGPFGQVSGWREDLRANSSSNKYWATAALVDLTLT